MRRGYRRAAAVRVVMEVVTVVVPARDRAQLDAIYRELSTHPAGEAGVVNAAMDAPTPRAGLLRFRHLGLCDDEPFFGYCRPLPPRAPQMLDEFMVG